MKKLVALCLISGMLSTTMMNAQAGNGESEIDTLESKTGYEVLKDENGNVYDLGGAEIVIRNWWSTGEPAVAYNSYQKAKLDYLDWAMETYNFTIKEVAIGDWDSAPQDFVDYVNEDGDDNYYLFTLHDDLITSQSMHEGLMYDLNSLSCLDFTENKFQRANVYKKYTYKEKVYAMSGDYSEPRCGMFFNRRILKEAGIDPDIIYDMQANGIWTWDAWTEIMEKVQRDTDGDGTIDIWGFDANYPSPVTAAVYSNGGEIIGMENGQYTYELENPKTLEALEWITDCLDKYALERPADTEWDYYKEAFLNGECAFMPDEAYVAGIYGFLLDNMKDEVGFVMFPKAPKAKDYINCWTNNIYVIPACYSEDKAWKIAFAYDIYTNDVPGYEDYYDYSIYSNHYWDERATNETIPMMLKKGMIAYDSMLTELENGIGPDFLQKFHQGMSKEELQEIIDDARDSFQVAVAQANNDIKDVHVKSWQYKFVRQVMDLGIMNGKSKTKNDKVIFDPNNDLTRAEFVRTLYNKESKPANIQYSDRFTDVKEGQWYTDAILWAYNAGLVKGKKDDYFDVSGKITREEIATILYKYAVMKGYDVTKEKDFSEYEDGASVSGWAVNYMKWALGNNIMKGQGTKIAPGARATRAESATMITNFMSTYEGLK